MHRVVYDTRFFAEYFFSEDVAFLRKAREAIRKADQRLVSAIVIHEVYQLILEKKGREVAILRVMILEKDFKVITVDSEIAKSSAELRHKYRLSLADSIIAATALAMKATCITDDPHFERVTEIKTAWV